MVLGIPSTNLEIFRKISSIAPNETPVLKPTVAVKTRTTNNRKFLKFFKIKKKIRVHILVTPSENHKSIQYSTIHVLKNSH